MTIKIRKSIKFNKVSKFREHMFKKPFEKGSAAVESLK